MSVSKDRRNARRCALQAMYEMDLGGGAASPDNAVDSLAGAFRDDAEISESKACLEQGLELARAAWSAREISDVAIASLSPEWPIHRQPAVDRNVIRIAVYEISLGVEPPVAVIDSAVELAREFGGEQSPAFVNAVLDRWWKERGGKR
ncbi:MAG: transcription antitermination factor NusB [Planctomycetes bacterium]|nr:transcription antitermination factor NusB [Planctomycetota bacterium]